MGKKSLSIFALVALAVVLAGCTRNPTAQNQTPAPANDAGSAAGGGIALAYSFEMNSQGFTPNKTTTKVGETVTWTNTDKVNHQIVGDNGEFKSAILKPGDRFEYKFQKKGTYTFHCGIHGQMKGTVVVE